MIVRKSLFCVGRSGARGFLGVWVKAVKAGGYGGAENAARAGVELKNMDLRRVSVESGNGTRVTNEIRSSRIEFRSGVLEDVAKGKPKSARSGLSGVVGRVAGNFIWEAI